MSNFLKNAEGAKILWVSVLLVIGIINFFYIPLRTNFTHIQPDGGDAVFNMLILEHTYKSFFDFNYSGDFYNPLFYAHLTNVLTMSDNLLGSAFIYWILRIFFSSLVAFQLWEIICVVLTFLTMLTFARYLKINFPLATIISYAFSFGVLRFSEVGHPQLLPQFFTPLVWLFILKFIRNPSLGHLNLFMLFLVLQTFSGFYLGWFLVLSLMISFFVLFYVFRDSVQAVVQFLKANYKNVVISLVFWGFLLSLFWTPYIITSFKYKTALDWGVYEQNLPQLLSFTKAPQNSLYRYLLGQRNLPFTYGDYLFPGIFGVIAFGLGVMTFAKKIDSKSEDLLLAKVFFVVAAALLVMSIKVFGYSIWQIIHIFVPGADAIRYVYRIWVIAYFYLFMSAGLLLTIFAPRIHKLLFGVVVIIFFLENINVSSNLPAFDMRYFEDNSSKIVSEIQNRSCSMFYISDESTQKPDLNITGQLTAVNAAMYTNIPTLNGYSGFNPYKNADMLTLSEIKAVVQDKPQPRFCYLHGAYTGDVLTINAIETFGVFVPN